MKCTVCEKADSKRCSGCNGLKSYCGVACQKADWKNHKYVCKYHARAAELMNSVNTLRGPCFKTFVSEMSLDKCTTASLVMALMTISVKGCYVSEEIANKATKMLDIIDLNGFIRKMIDPSSVKKILE